MAFGICYLDESGTDNNCETAVVGGLVIPPHAADWLADDWRECLKCFKVDWPLHMREQKSGLDRYEFFKEIANIIRRRSAFTISCFVSSTQSREQFDGVSELSMYGAAFLNVVLLNGGSARAAKYDRKLPYVLDKGNAYRDHVEQAHGFMETRDKYAHYIGAPDFECDDRVAALQAADVVSWAVRRRRDFKLEGDFEPLNRILDSTDHVQHEYKKTAMIEIAKDLRAKAAAQSD